MASSGSEYFSSAEIALFQELLDALWLENLYGFQTHCLAAEPGLVKIRLSPEKAVVISASWLKTSYRPIRFTGRYVQLLDAGEQALLPNLAACIRALGKAQWWPQHVSTKVFENYATLATQHLQFFLAQESALLPQIQTGKPVSLLQWEKLSCLRDRPFHPFSHVKQGWNMKDEQHFGCFSNAPVRPYWLAIPHTLLLTQTDIAVAGKGPENTSPDLLWKEILSNADFRQLRAAVDDAQLANDYHVVPVHPWQWRWLNQTPKKDRRTWLRACVLLSCSKGQALRVGELSATASLRSLISRENPALHVKLSCSIRALGATRTQPPRYLHNGIMAQQVLQRLRANDEWLKDNIWLCEEQSWGAVLGHANKPTPTQAKDAPWLTEHLREETGEISYLLRRYPPSLLQAQCTLVPLSALAVTAQDEHQAPAWQWLIHSIKDHLPADKNASLCEADRAEQLFERIISLLVELGYRCLRNGVMPELHGQNILLIVGPAEDKSPPSKNLVIKGLLLRDHDTLRICPSLMSAAGNPVPPYFINADTPNTLVLDTAEALFAYFQTLAIEVCSYAMAATVATNFAIEEQRLWQRMNTALTDRIQLLAHYSDLDILVSTILCRATWPFKCLLDPLLHQHSPSTGMPSALTQVANPLLCRDA